MTAVLLPDATPTVGEDAVAQLRDACGRVVRRLPGGDAFELLDMLGQGGFGVVWRARWALTGTVVALKVSHDEDPGKVRFLRREFRHIARRYHPNVAPVYELRSDDRGAFLVMPVIPGEHLDRYVGDGPFAERLARLTGVVGGLLDGLAALHEWGLVHGDLKPENLLASPAGCVLLDYNLTADEVENAGMLEGADVRFFDPSSMTEGASRASDVYSLGAVLYHVLTGAYPHGGARRRDDRSYRSLATVAPDAPAWLVDLLARMLRADAGDRATLAEVTQAWGFPVRPQVEAAGGRFFGRTEELAALRAWHDAGRGVRVAHIRGSSGLGKSTLVQEFERMLQASRSLPGADVVMLRGACERNGAAAFDAFEAVVDQLLMRSYLSAGVEAALSTSDVAIAEGIFPALAERGVQLRGDPLAGLVGDQLRRTRIAAFRAVLADVARRVRLVVCLDDMQWARGDCEALLGALVDGDDAPEVAWLLVSRDGEPDAPAWSPKVRRPVHTVDLSPMSAVDMRALWEAARGDATLPSADVLTSFGGSPFVLTICARFAPHGAPLGGADEVLALISDAVSHLDPDARLLVTVAAMLGFPVSLPELLSIAGLTLAALPEVLHLDASRWLVVDERAGRGSVRISHDILARAVAERMSEDERVSWHSTIFEALRHVASTGAARLYPHAAAAGRTDALGQLALRAAEEALVANQFLAAESWYRRAEEHGGLDLDRADVTARRAYAMSCVGRASQAAELYGGAAELRGGDDDQSFDWRVSSVVSRYRAGDYTAGHAQVVALLAPLGVTLPANERRAIASGVVQRLLLYVRGWRGFVIRDVVAREDHRFLQATHHTFGFLVGTQFALADVMMVMAFRRALRSGARGPLLNGLNYEAMVLTSLSSLLRGLGLDRWATREARDMLSRSREIAGDEVYGIAACDLGSASVAWSVGEWSMCATQAALARDGLVRGRIDTRYEIASATLYRMTGLWWSGDLATLAREHAELWEDANLRRQTFFIDTLRLGDCATPWLMGDDPERLLREATDAEPSWADAPVNTMAYQSLLGVVRAHLYRDDPEAAWRELERVWPHMVAGTYTGMVMTGLSLFLARGTTAALLAVRQPDRAKAWLREVDAAVRELRWRRVHAHADRFATVVAACGLAARGKTTEAHVVLARLGDSLEEAGVAVYAAAARASHPAHREAGLGALSAMGVVRPDRFAAMLFPTFPIEG